MGVPFLPVRGMLESAYPKVNPRLQVIPGPFGGEDLVVVQALRPDAALVHAAQADPQGNILIPWATDWVLAIRAARRVIATVEERVETDLKDEVEWRLISQVHLTALVHRPGGAAPTGFPGYYGRDEAHLESYLKAARDPALFARYLEEYVLKEGA